jgi:hypothetical protein
MGKNPGTMSPFLPNSNPAPGPKFDYKLKWFKRFTPHVRSLLKAESLWFSSATTT